MMIFKFLVEDRADHELMKRTLRVFIMSIYLYDDIVVAVAADHSFSTVDDPQLSDLLTCDPIITLQTPILHRSLLEKRDITHCRSR